MEALNIVEASCDSQLLVIDKLADEIWHEHFTPIIGTDQVEYMIKKFQCFEALKSQLAQGYKYYILNYQNKAVGYTGIKIEAGSLFLSKLYILKEYRGNKISSEVIKFLVTLCNQQGLSKIWLTVNRFNSNTINVYEKLGFIKTRTQQLDIGNGFIMDDYIMEKSILPSA